MRRFSVALLKAGFTVHLANRGREYWNKDLGESSYRYMPRNFTYAHLDGVVCTLCDDQENFQGCFTFRRTVIVLRPSVELLDMQQVDRWVVTCFMAQAMRL